LGNNFHSRAQIMVNGERRDRSRTGIDFDDRIVLTVPKAWETPAAAPARVWQAPDVPFPALVKTQRICAPGDGFAKLHQSRQCVIPSATYPRALMFIHRLPSG
jgi:hypothetical protein